MTTHTPRGRPKPHAHTDKHTRGEKLSAAVSTKPQSSHQTVVATRHNTPQVGWAQTSVSNLLGTKIQLHGITNTGTWVLKCRLKKGALLDDTAWTLHHPSTETKKARKPYELSRPLQTVLLITRFNPVFRDNQLESDWESYWSETTDRKTNKTDSKEIERRDMSRDIHLLN